MKSCRTVSTCVDCPARQRGMLASLAGESGEFVSLLSCITLEERAELPANIGRYAFGIVRRGVLVRERVDSSGARTAVDAAGRGAYVPLGLSPGCTGYAASRVLLCVYREPNLEHISGQAKLAIDLMTLASETLERVERIAEARGRARGAERIEALHEALKEWLGPHGFEDLRQRDLAALLGMRTETVCRLLRARSRSIADLA